MKEINNDILHENLLKRKPLLSYDENADFDLWREKVREKFIDLLCIDDIESNACEIKVEIEEEVKKDGYTRYRYTFESERGCTVPCYLLIPDTGKQKYPVMLCVQGHSSGFHISIGEVKYHPCDDEDVQSCTFALDAVKNGYAALCIEQRGLGERQPATAERGRVEFNGCPCLFTAMTGLLSGRTLLGERVWDISKAIDSLSAFEGLDLDDISCVGHSGGGTATYYSACYDSRIKVVIPNCSICTYRDSIGDMWHCTCNYVPKMAKYFDMGELSALIAPRKLIVSHGKTDPIFPIKGTYEVYSVIEQIYKKAGAEDNCVLLQHEGKHYFDKQLVFGKVGRN